MKCVIENIVVDVSFNQFGGVSTFCFLELVSKCKLELFGLLFFSLKDIKV
jgi:hypothetical protein